MGSIDLTSPPARERIGISAGTPARLLGVSRPATHLIWPLAVALAVAFIAPSDADARRRRSKKKRANMPVNWVWPPSAEMKAAGKKCKQELSELGVAFEKAPAERKVANPILVPDMEIGGLKISPIFRKPPFVMDCHLALAFARHAELFRAAGIIELRFSTIHDYRHVRLNGRTKGALSRHALGLAIDVFQVVTDDGDTIFIEEQYGQESGARLVPLHGALVASGGFRAVLSPHNDPRSHNDHFHLEARMEIGAPKAGKANKKKITKRAKRRAENRAKRRAKKTAKTKNSRNAKKLRKRKKKRGRTTQRR